MHTHAHAHTHTHSGTLIQKLTSPEVKRIKNQVGTTRLLQSGQIYIQFFTVNTFFIFLFQEPSTDTSTAGPTTATTDTVTDEEPVKVKPSIIEAIDQTANEIEPLLEPEAVTELVIESLTRLPR